MSDATYRSFLLRIWRSSTPTGPGWRTVLEDVQTGERRGFAGLEEATQFLDSLLVDELVGPAQTAAPEVTPLAARQTPEESQRL